jgi:transcriptional regulator of acetoin/glycerol metabolism
VLENLVDADVCAKQAAKQLGIARSTLYHELAALRLQASADTAFRN